MDITIKHPSNLLAAWFEGLMLREEKTALGIKQSWDLVTHRY